MEIRRAWTVGAPLKKSHPLRSGLILPVNTPSTVSTILVGFSTNCVP